MRIGRARHPDHDRRQGPPALPARWTEVGASTARKSSLERWFVEWATPWVHARAIIIGCTQRRKGRSLYLYYDPLVHARCLMNRRMTFRIDIHSQNPIRRVISLAGLSYWFCSNSSLRMGNGVAKRPLGSDSGTVTILLKLSRAVLRVRTDVFPSSSKGSLLTVDYALTHRCENPHGIVGRLLRCHPSILNC